MAAGNATIGALRVSLGLDSAQFTEGLKKSQSSLAGFGKNAGLAGAAAGAAIATAAIAIGAALKGAIDNADELGKTAQKIGVTVEELSRLKYAAELSDVSLDGLSTGLKRLSANMASVAAGGSGPAAQAFKALGVSVTDASGQLKSGSAVMTEVAGKFGGMQDGAGKTALAMALFGKSGADLIPLLNSGADGLKEMADEADALGVTIDTKTAKSAEAFNDNLTRLKAAAGGITTQLAAQMLPAMEGVSSVMVGLAQNTALMSAVGKGLSITLKGLVSAGVIVGAVFATLGQAVGSTAKAIIRITNLDFVGATKALSEGGRGMAQTITGAVSMIKGVWSTGGAGVAAAAPKVSDQLAAPMMQAGGKIKAAGARAAKEAKDATDKLRDAGQRVLDGLLSDDEAYAKKFAEDRKTLDDLRRKDLISLEKYLDAIERMENERKGRGLKLTKIDASATLIDQPEAEAAKKGLDGLINRMEDARIAADDVSNSVQDIFYGFKNNNWMTAVSGLLKAVQSVQKAFASGSTADKFSAIAGVAQGVGGAIGGTAGAGISGAASGALAGFTVAGPVGAVVGGIVGLLGGIFGSSSAKKKAKREAEERARQAEADRLAKVEAARKNLEIRLMELSGDAVGALAKQREYELETVDESLKEQQKAVWAAEDLAEANAKLAAIAATRRDLEIEAMERTGDALGALTAQREDYLKGLDDSLDPLQKAVWAVIDANDALAKSQDEVATARAAVQDAYEAESRELQAVADKFRGLADGLRSYRASLDGAQQGTQSLASAAAAFAKVSRAARLGDEGALGSLQGVSEAFRTAAKSQAKTAFEQARIDGQIKNAVDAAADTAERTATNAEQQLTALTASLGTLITVNTSVLSVRDAVTGLGAAMWAQASALTAQAEAQQAVLAAAPDLTQTASTAAQIEAMRADLNAGLIAIAQNTSTTARIQQRWEGDGLPETRDLSVAA